METGTTNFINNSLCPGGRMKKKKHIKIRKYRKWLTEELKSYNFSIATQKIDILQSYFQKSGSVTHIIWKAQKVGYQRNKYVSNPSLWKLNDIYLSYYLTCNYNGTPSPLTFLYDNKI